MYKKIALALLLTLTFSQATKAECSNHLMSKPMKFEHQRFNIQQDTTSPEMLIFKNSFNGHHYMSKSIDTKEHQAVYRHIR